MKKRLLITVMSHELVAENHFVGKTNLIPGIKLQGDWGEIVALEGSKSPWEAQGATKTSPSVFASFEKASTCAKRTFCWEKSSKN